MAHPFQQRKLLVTVWGLAVQGAATYACVRCYAPTRKAPALGGLSCCTSSPPPAWHRGTQVSKASVGWEHSDAGPSGGYVTLVAGPFRCATSLPAMVQVRNLPLARSLVHASERACRRRRRRVDDDDHQVARSRSTSLTAVQVLCRWPHGDWGREGGGGRAWMGVGA